MPYGPGEWGFEEYLSFHGSGRYSPEQKIEYQQNGEWKKLREGEYLPDLMHTSSSASSRRTRTSRSSFITRCRTSTARS
jgi:hypothetical protein